LNIWLSKHKDKMPKPPAIKKKSYSGMKPDLSKMPEFFNSELEDLRDGRVDTRNATWFKMAMVMVDRNFQLNEILSHLDGFYTEEPDFKRSEWEGCIKSAYKRGIEGV